MIPQQVGWGTGEQTDVTIGVSFDDCEVGCDVAGDEVVDGGSRDVVACDFHALSAWKTCRVANPLGVGHSEISVGRGILGVCTQRYLPDPTGAHEASALAGVEQPSGGLGG